MASQASLQFPASPDRAQPTRIRSQIDAEVDEILSPNDDPESARERAVLAALPLAESIANRYRGRGADVEDLLQVARLGLVKAVRGYRPGSPAGFTAYAAPTISGEVKRHFRDHQWLIRPPRALQELQHQVAECRRTLAQSLGRMVTDDEIAHALGIDTSRVRAALISRYAYHAAPADALLDHPSTDGGYDRVLERATLRQLCDRLGPQDSRLVWLRFVEGRSQASIAEEIGVSQMQVSRLLSALLRRLRGLLEEDERLAG